MGMWADFPIFRLSLSFTKIPPYTALNSKFREPENSPDILDDPLLSSPISQGKKKKKQASTTPKNIPTSPEPPAVKTSSTSMVSRSAV